MTMVLISCERWNTHQLLQFVRRLIYVTALEYDKTREMVPIRGILDDDMIAICFIYPVEVG
jgi:hypothetical protein